MRTKRFKSCKNIKANIRWLVTGTPIQNRKQDFYNLCSMAGMDPSFYLDQTNMSVIKQFYLLRRTKAQVGIDLPPVNKTEHIIPWEDKQEMLLAEELHSLLRLSNVSSNKKKELGSAMDGLCPLVYLMRCRQVCVLPSLLNKQLDSFVSKGVIQPEYLESAKFSSKLDAMIHIILERKDNGKGKIIFCHYREEIDVVVDRLLKGGLTKVVSYDGRNSGGDNLKNLADPADALVLQIQTGCEGLNLQTHFSEIYFVSPHWNPSIEDQAIARCHRIGQTKPVDIFKFVMSGFREDLEQEQDQNQTHKKSTTMETYVNSVQTNKREIIKDMLDM
jgi:SNF2 family DNA or RNA helicase